MDRIGPFASFLKVTGHPERVAMQKVVRRRAGIDGSATWAVGEAGLPFRVRTEEFAINYQSARLRYRQYLTLTYLPAVDIDLAGITEPFALYEVLEVVPEGIYAILHGSVGGDGTVYQGKVDAIWTLLPLNPLVQPP